MEMTRHTIEIDPNAERGLKTHLDFVFSEVLKLLPDGIQNEVGKEIYAAGGAIVSYIQGEEIHDYDFWLKSEAAVEIVKRHFTTAIPQVISVTPNAITIQFNPLYPVVQIVTRFYGEPDRIFTSFDYEHCKAYYTPQDGTLVYNNSLVIEKKLVYTGLDGYPVNALSRLVKYINRGYTVDKKSLLVLAEKLGRLDWDNTDIVANQLIGFYGSSLE